MPTATPTWETGTAARSTAAALDQTTPIPEVAALRRGSVPANGRSSRLATPGGERRRRRGTGWVAGSFLLCPCHLPVTLALLGTVLGGTAAGAALRQYPLIAGAIITLAWAIGTRRGLRLLRAGPGCPIR